MRALENGRWFAQVGNTGITALIDHKGVIRNQLAPDQAGVLEEQAQLRTGRTPFMVAGNAPLLVAAALTMLFLVQRRHRHRNTG